MFAQGWNHETLLDPLGHLLSAASLYTLLQAPLPFRCIRLKHLYICFLPRLIELNGRSKLCVRDVI